MSASTLNVDEWRAERGIAVDYDYADTVDKLRITRDPAYGFELDDSRYSPQPWLVDGFNTVTGQYSMWTQSYGTFDSAVSDLPALWQEYVVEPARLDAESEEEDHDGSN